MARSIRGERGARLRSARQATGLSVAQVADQSGYSPSGVRAIENGQNDLKPDVAELLAPIVKTTAGWLLTGEGDGGPRPLVPVVGFVGAGDAAHYYDTSQGPGRWVDAPENAGPDTVAAEVKGQSIGRYFDGWLVFYDEVRSPVTADQIGELCVVGLPDGRILVKWLQAGRDGRFHLLSQTEEPMFDQEIAWAARVTNMKPR